MKKPAVIFGLIVILFSCSKRPTDTIICEFDDIKNDTALIGYLPQSNLDIEIIDTVLIKNGILRTNFKANELHEVIIIPFKLLSKMSLHGARISFYIDTGETVYIKSKLLEDNYFDYSIKGNILSEQANQLRKELLDVISERVKIDNEFYSEAYSLKTQQEIDLYWEKRNPIFEEYQKIMSEYASNHPDYEYSARILCGQKDKNEVVEIYNTLSENVKNSHFGIIVGDRIRGWLLTTPGMEFPNIRGKTISNNDFSLRDFRNKYVLLDFWGSWCVPCLAEIPELIEINNKYNENLIMVGIACNDNREKLLKTIENNGINWIQIMEGTTRETKYSQKFGIVSYPTKVLLDKKGETIKTYIGLDENLYHDLDSLIKN